MTLKDPFVEAFLDACYEGDLPKTQEAIASGRLNSEDLDDGLAEATSMAHTELVAALFDAGASVSAKPVDALPRDGRLEVQHPAVVRLFFGHGLDPNATDSNGEPILAFMQDPECAREFLSRGADPNRVGPQGTPVLLTAIACLREDDTTLLELFLEYGARLKPEHLFEALGRRDTDSQFKTSYLLGKGLDPNASHTTWGTPLHCAIRNNHTSAIKVLLDAGADPTVRSEGRHFHGKTALEVAEWVRNPNDRSAILSLLQSAQERDAISQDKEMSQ
ncbi:uncharacterized protein N7482_009410 [Penicillium canariense]|uniref:Uncharacterized protein n=1 Tax=Penicillium canariense TaxID=189055 RepID=A0A9W9LG13_9EURO|nr:uncharacterized protein N7482_009410 [Penicillium canariense]KAJ5152932.1 hypothetical protein N7482_009410 [Penicillium canariense]